MERTLSIERLYFLGDYKNIKIGASMTGIPLVSEESVRNILLNLMITCDIAFQDYKDYNEKIKRDRGTDVLVALKEEKERIEKELNVEIIEEKEND